MAKQWMAIVEEATPGTDPGSGYLGIPVTGALMPSPEITDESRKEFRGDDSALGSSEVVRRGEAWTYTLECAWYPGSEAIDLLFKHLFGYALTPRAAVDTSAFEGIFYPDPNPFGVGANLGTKAIGLAAHTDEEGTTKKQYFGAGLVKSVSITGEGTDDVKLAFEIMGAGEYITLDQTADAMPTMPTASPFTSKDALCYIGSETEATRTGTAPDYTAIDENTMADFTPDSFTIEITNGLDQKVAMNGINGPSKTHRAEQFAITVETPIDYDDPSSGFSSADEYKAYIAGIRKRALMFKLDNGELAGALTENYSAIIDLPNMLLNSEAPELNPEGQQPSVALSWSSLWSTETEYPASFFTVNQNETP